MSKPRIVKDYDKLEEQIQEQIKLVYPMGFTHHLVSFVNREGRKQMGLPFETEERYFLVRMSMERADAIIEDDDDYDDEGVLRDDIRDEYAEKYDDIDYLELNSNGDNDFEEEEAEDKD